MDHQEDPIDALSALLTTSFDVNFALSPSSPAQRDDSGGVLSSSDSSSSGHSSVRFAPSVMCSPSFVSTVSSERPALPRRAGNTPFLLKKIRKLGRSGGKRSKYFPDGAVGVMVERETEVVSVEARPVEHFADTSSSTSDERRFSDTTQSSFASTTSTTTGTSNSSSMFLPTPSSHRTEFFASGFLSPPVDASKRLSTISIDSGYELSFVDPESECYPHESFNSLVDFGLGSGPEEEVSDVVGEESVSPFSQHQNIQLQILQSSIPIPLPKPLPTFPHTPKKKTSIAFPLPTLTPPASPSSTNDHPCFVHSEEAPAFEYDVFAKGPPQVVNGSRFGSPASVDSFWTAPASPSMTTRDVNKEKSRRRKSSITSSTNSSPVIKGRARSSSDALYAPMTPPLSPDMDLVLQHAPQPLQPSFVLTSADGDGRRASTSVSLVFTPPSPSPSPIRKRRRLGAVPRRTGPPPQCPLPAPPSDDPFSIVAANPVSPYAVAEPPAPTPSNSTLPPPPPLTLCALQSISPLRKLLLPIADQLSPVEELESPVLFAPPVVSGLSLTKPLPTPKKQPSPIKSRIPVLTALHQQRGHMKRRSSCPSYSTVLSQPSAPEPPKLAKRPSSPFPLLSATMPSQREKIRSEADSFVDFGYSSSSEDEYDDRIEVSRSCPSGRGARFDGS
ncbi:hypothetical protein DL96DRAFT_110734 [Flagelloscypha sp. PMI_526]|nr:hypothetical protein DL96DRAFT_110734 [Flagelloscypha sp. PMI_526]